MLKLIYICYKVDSSIFNEIGKFKLNICKGVVGTNCSPLSGACFESGQKVNWVNFSFSKNLLKFFLLFLNLIFTSQFKNLGFLKSPPRLLLSGEVEIVYENGDSCDSELTSSVIKIVCNKNAEVKIFYFNKSSINFNVTKFISLL